MLRLTNVEVTTTVTDTHSGLSRTYTNAQGTPFMPLHLEKGTLVEQVVQRS